MSMMVDFRTVITFIVITVRVTKGTAETNQSLLFADLFKNYHSEIRPVCGEDKAIETKIGISVRQIIDLNEPKQILTLNAWMRMNWFDCQLQWDPANYGGLESVIVPNTMVWIPDITLYDNAGDGIPGFKDYRVSISYTGQMSYNFPTIINSLCKVDVTYFPFDTQVCRLPFGSWAYHGLQLDVTNRSTEGDLSTFLKNGEWDLLGIPQVRHVLVYPCCPQPYPDVTFYIRMKRKSLFYVLNLLFPCILITSVALLGFLLPPDSGEKISLEITVLLSLAVFLLVVSETLPPTSETFPYIGLYFCLSMMLVTFSTVLTVVVLNFHFKGQHGKPVPRWIRSFFLETLGSLLRVKCKEQIHPSTFEANNLDFSNHNNPAFENDLGKTRENSQRENILHEVNSSPDQLSPMLNVLKEQLTVLNKIKDVYDLKAKHDAMAAEWITVAVVMDRLFLVLFSLISFSCTLGILLKSAS